MLKKDNNPNPKPRNKFFIVVNVLLLIFFVSILAYVYMSQIDVFWQTTNEMISLNTKSYEKTLSLWFAPRIKLVDTIYEDLIYFNMVEKNELDMFFTAVTIANHDVMATYIGTEDGQIVFDFGQEAPEGFNPTVRVWYILAMENFGRTVVSEPYIDILTGRLIVTITRAIELSGGMKGAIGVDVDLSELTDFVGSIHSYNNGSAFLLSADEKIITHNDDRYLPKDVNGVATFHNYSDIEVSDVKRIFTSSPEVTLQRLIREGVEEYVSTVILGEVGWTLGIKIPVSDFDENLWQIASPLLVTLVVGIGVFAASITLYILHMLMLIRANEVIENQKLELAEQMITIEELGFIDALTNIPNRRNFDNRSNEEWKRSARDNKPCSLCMIDIDHFKKLNDTYGHPYGDEALKLVADIIKSSIQRPGDIAARWGGEEFIVMLPNTNIESAKGVAEKIRYNIENADMPEYTGDGEKPEKASLTVSIGVASVLPSAENSVNDLIIVADKALYKAKQTGRNKVCNVT